jgi:hypothetical protein
MLAGRSLTLAEVRAMTIPEIKAFVDILTGKVSPSSRGRRIVPVRRKGR